MKAPKLFYNVDATIDKLCKQIEKAMRLVNYIQKEKDKIMSPRPKIIFRQKPETSRGIKNKNLRMRVVYLGRRGGMLLLKYQNIKKRLAGWSEPC